MGGAATTPGPAGAGENRPVVNAGTLARIATPAPAGDDQRLFESARQALEAEIANVGAHGAIDGATRLAYARQVRAAADELAAQATAGRIGWRQAAEQARGLRDSVMAITRGRSTPVGRAFAESIKRQGPTLNELVARYTLKLHGAGADFNALTAAQREAIYAEVVAAAGRANPGVTRVMRGASRAGRGLLVLSLAISVYQVATAEDKVAAAEQEAAVTGAGIAGGIAGGALAGLACGPGAPVCVTIGAFAGGALAAFGVDLLW